MCYHYTTEACWLLKSAVLEVSYKVQIQALKDKGLNLRGCVKERRSADQVAIVSVSHHSVRTPFASWHL